MAVINRSFWPIYPVIGEALLRLVEELSGQSQVCVVAQDHVGLQQHLNKELRGGSARFFAIKSFSNSSSSIFTRVLDALFFSLSVLFTLLWTRPEKVYISTDPPITVPFIVMIYCKLFGAKYIYHLQDIHPEAANIIIKVNRYIYKLLKCMDNMVIRHADCIITITQQMADEIRWRSRSEPVIHILDNPAVSFDAIDLSQPKINGVSFCGNAGRLQRIPLIMDSIKKYIDQGGTLKFVFAGGGIYSDDLKRLADNYKQVTYKGLVSAEEAANLNVQYSWALLPIEDEVTRYAFPSKLSSYVVSGANVLAVCGSTTSVAKRIKNYSLGVVCNPDQDSLVNSFSMIELRSINLDLNITRREEFKEYLHFDHFVGKLIKLLKKN